MVVGDILTHNNMRFPDKLGLVDERLRLTWGQVNGRVNRLANAMLGLGVKKGDRVAILSENCVPFAEILFAVAKLGVIGVGLNYRLTSKQLQSVIADCTPKAIFVENRFDHIIKDIQSQMDSVELIVGLGPSHHCPYDYETLQAQYPSNELTIQVEEQDIFILLYTSGTTGAPKAVPITHKARVIESLLLATVYRCSSNDVAMLGPALFANGGQTLFFNYCAMGMGIVVVPFVGKIVAELCEKEKVTCMTVVPIRYQIIRDYLNTCSQTYDLSSITKVLIGAAQPCPYDKLKEIMEFFGVSYSLQTYGMTETAGPAICLLPEEVAAGMRPDATWKERQRINSVGKPLLGLQVRVVDEADNDVPAGQVGEILLKGDTVMSGYWKKLELNQQVLRGGWYHTSDLGMLDEDGYLYFVGRKDFQIHTGGIFVTPAEVEDVIARHPAVNEVAVIGLPSERWGEEVTAIVVPKEGAVVSEAMIEDHCRKTLAGFQVPKHVYFRNDLPKHPEYGRIQVKELQRIYQKK